MDRILEIRNLSKSFSAANVGIGRLGNDRRNVINGLSMDVVRGSITTLVGGNGAGKTTLFNMISGLLRPDSGYVIFSNGNESVDCTRARPWEIASSGAGRLFQGSRVYGQMSVTDHLLIQAGRKSGENILQDVFLPVRKRRERNDKLNFIHEILEGFDEFSELLREGARPASSLSYARQRLLGLAGLLVGDYDLLLLDEPSSGLGPETREMLKSLFKKLRAAGKTVFLIEHNMDLISDASDICHFMARGEILVSGPPEMIIDHEEVKRSYLM